MAIIYGGHECCETGGYTVTTEHVAPLNNVEVKFQVCAEHVADVVQDNTSSLNRLDVFELASVKVTLSESAKAQHEVARNDQAMRMAQIMLEEGLSAELIR